MENSVDLGWFLVSDEWVLGGGLGVVMRLILGLKEGVKEGLKWGQRGTI